MPRTVRPDGERIKWLRAQRDWETMDLARAADCSYRTVENLEAGNHTYRRILAAIAQALEVSYKELLLGPDDDEPEKPDALIEGAVRLVLAKAFHSFDATKELTVLLRWVEYGCHLQCDIRLQSVKDGNSTIITLDMAEEDVLGVVRYMPQLLHQTTSEYYELENAIRTISKSVLLAAARPTVDLYAFRALDNLNLDDAFKEVKELYRDADSIVSIEVSESAHFSDRTLAGWKHPPSKQKS
jgi:transcriptional regulator with XRE-family HTH domain